MSAVPYTATAVLLTVAIRSQTVPYINELETYSTVITTAGIQLMAAVWDRKKSSFVISYKRIERDEYKL
jgi:hypothetical protein